ncbi:hypothetical protein [Pseudoclavibacter sp. 8L]|uniref:hypothetical protein n=1 Tax=Pseudoclavibacter sp. 8L TaxID=2653162 RepID=UPI0012F462EF|nr:hypothetical protein [Pseudoclavibacter sp. 8L]VXB32787.1 conserved hypothetical protein [Pseudoclavibacter sp. 8L]
MDFRKLHLAWSDVGRAVTWGEAISLVRELQRDTGSHLFASIQGFSYIASLPQIASVLLLEHEKNKYREEGQERFKFPLPMSRGDEKPVVTPEERAAGKAELAKRSVFRDR